MTATAKCQRHDCSNTINQPQTGRRKRFCSDACRIRVHRRNKTPAKANGHPAELNAPRPFATKTARFVTSKINELATPQKQGIGQHFGARNCRSEVRHPSRGHQCPRLGRGR
jgi:hypothetical protein